jgi:hypothetical protein
LFGWHIWIEYWQKIVPQQVWIIEAGQGLGFLASSLCGARLAGLPLNVAWIIQDTVSAIALAMVVWTFWRRRDPVLSVALFVTATFLFLPYVFCYDMVIFGLVIVMLRARADNCALDHALLIAVWSLPVTMMIAAIVSVPLAPIVLIAFAISLFFRLHTDNAREDGSSDAHLVA